MRASDLRGILRYTSQFRDKLFVLSLDSAIVDAANFKNLVLDISVLRSVNVRMILVHGAGNKLKDITRRLGVSPSDLEGEGITDEVTLEAATLASSMLSQRILDCLAEADLSGAVTNAVTAHPSGIVGGQDKGLTGRAEKIDAALFMKLLDAGIIPVVPPIGTDGAGQAFRLESNHVALEVAKALKAAKLIYLGISNGVEDAGRLAAQFSIEEAEAFLKEPEAAADHYLKSKMEHMLQACRHGVHRAHLIDARTDEALISELFSSEGVGTMVYANEYEAIRQAERADIPAIERLIRNSISEEEVLQRTVLDIEQHIEDFFIFEIDRNIIGCVALHFLEGEPPSGELACLVVAEAHANQGIGKKLTEFIVHCARKRKLSRVFALSTRAFNYFTQQQGFSESSAEALPAGRQAQYHASGRNSRVLVKEL